MKTFFFITLFPLPITLWSLVSSLFHKEPEFTPGCFWFLTFHLFFYPLQGDSCFHHLAAISSFSSQQLSFKSLCCLTHSSIWECWPLPLLETLFPCLWILNLLPSLFSSGSHSCLLGMLAFFSWPPSYLTRTGSQVALGLSLSCVTLERLCNLDQIPHL